jgi:SAM-dependent methyltransferase
MKNGTLFFQAYMGDGGGKKIIEVGSQDVNGSLRQVKPRDCKYIGVDFVKAKGVDVVIDPEDPYILPFEDNYADAIVTSSVFEHSEFFWLLFIELLRLLKPEGLLYINAPSYGDFHRYPVDCYRFYPDFGSAMEKWAKRSGSPNTVLLESFVCRQDLAWNDNVTVFLKDKAFIGNYPTRILDSKVDFLNGKKFGSEKVLSMSGPTSPQLVSIGVKAVLSGELVVNRQKP